MCLWKSASRTTTIPSASILSRAASTGKAVGFHHGIVAEDDSMWYICRPKEWRHDIPILTIPILPRALVSYPLKVKLALSVFVRIILPLIAGVLGTACAVGQTGTGSSTKPQVPLPNVQGSAKAQATIPICPPAGLSRSQPSDRGTGDHKVILSWNASSHSPDNANDAVGYCLYRSKDRKALKQRPTCRECEQINSIPVGGTACVDDLVEDSTKYFYVVTAINGKGVISSSSNEVLAPIPAGKKTGFTPSDSPLPAACREWSRAGQTSATSH
jgi:hypothetical protein